MHLFITGTDTGVGKTYVAAGLVRAARAAGLDCVGLKPFCCGERGDAEQLWEAGGQTLTLNAVNPVWLRAPVAPYVAGMMENREVDVALAREAIAAAQAAHRHVIVEGAGGWLVPITAQMSMADMAEELGWPVLLVAENRLGALNHVRLTLESLARRHLRCIGVVLNQVRQGGAADDLATATNQGALEILTRTAVWSLQSEGEIRWISPWVGCLASGACDTIGDTL